MSGIHRHFHDELNQLKVRLLTMSGEAEAALGLAVEALLERDAAKAQRVLDGDRSLDLMEVEIEDQCLQLLALQQPMARDRSRQKRKRRRTESRTFKKGAKNSGQPQLRDSRSPGIGFFSQFGVKCQALKSLSEPLGQLGAVARRPPESRQTPQSGLGA